MGQQTCFPRQTACVTPFPLSSCSFPLIRKETACSRIGFCPFVPPTHKEKGQAEKLLLNSGNYLEVGNVDHFKHEVSRVSRSLFIEIWFLTPTFTWSKQVQEILTASHETYIPPARWGTPGCWSFTPLHHCGRARHQVLESNFKWASPRPTPPTPTCKEITVRPIRLSTSTLTIWHSLLKLSLFFLQLPVISGKVMLSLLSWLGNSPFSSQIWRFRCYKQGCEPNRNLFSSYIYTTSSDYWSLFRIKYWHGMPNANRYLCSHKVAGLSGQWGLEKFENWGQERWGEEGCFSNREHKSPGGPSIRSYREEEILTERAGSGSEFFTAFANETYLASFRKLALETAL